MLKIVKMPIADWLPYPPPLYINIGFELTLLAVDIHGQLNVRSILDKYHP